MKIIEGLKEIKRIEEKIHDLNSKIAKHCSDVDIENPVYPDQKAKISEWIQSVHDSIKEAIKLRIKIQETNLKTIVAIELDGKKVEHKISEWIIRRRIYSQMEKNSWESLTDKNLKEQKYSTTAGEKINIKVRRYFDPIERDKKTEIYRSEPNIIDRTLEVVNATTDLLD